MENSICFVVFIFESFPYQVDPNEYKHKIDLKADLSLSLFINYNEDKEMFLENKTMAKGNAIIIDTIGNHFMGWEGKARMCVNENTF